MSYRNRGREDTRFRPFASVVEKIAEQFVEVLSFASDGDLWRDPVIVVEALVGIDASM
jgi:hypothetical protein